VALTGMLLLTVSSMHFTDPLDVVLRRNPTDVADVWAAQSKESVGSGPALRFAGTLMDAGRGERRRGSIDILPGGDPSRQDEAKARNHIHGAAAVSSDRSHGCPRLS